jgi:hypothetical protein
MLRLHPTRIQIGVAFNIAHGDWQPVKKAVTLTSREAMLNIQQGFWWPLLPQRARESHGLACKFMLSVYYSREAAAA